VLDAHATTQWFFDRAEVAARIDPEVRKAFSKFGAFVRQRARTSLKYGDRSSAPGQVPTVHRTQTRRKTSKKTGKATVQRVSPLRELIFFAFDPIKDSVVIGPTLGGPNSGAPEAMEHGGVNRFVSNGEVRVAHYAARPFMAPAFAAEGEKVPDLFKDLIR
jgi:hypothetical protein